MAEALNSGADSNDLDFDYYAVIPSIMAYNRHEVDLTHLGH